ncbi:DUF6221 family protein [Arthrobacter sp. H41]|uniref:DUF6221 family protein n=1 Tax=Arthrobacter sp. H41 TaxID=1312978 RepID=UPI00047DA132|nr:DUF6221 family protein [Arthrobacter sp. H41]
MNELAAFILARVAEDYDLAQQARLLVVKPAILLLCAESRHAGDVGRDIGVAGHELLMDPLACHFMNQHPERVMVDCVAKQRLVAHVQSIDWDYEPAGEQDYMYKILELLALPWREHPECQSHWFSEGYEVR